MLFLVLAWYLTLCPIVLSWFRIPLPAFHEPNLHDFSEESAVVSSTETYEWIRPEEKAKRLEAIEIFQTSETNIGESPAPTIWSRIKEKVSEDMVILPDNRDLVHLIHAAPTHNESVLRLVKAMRGVAERFYTALDLWDKGSPMEKTLLIAFETLQGDGLTAPERLWALRVSRLLQSYLPTGDIKPVRLNPNTGPVCRGALEIFLTEGMDLTHEIHDKINVVPASEALERVELVMKIKNHFEDFQNEDPTANFRKIYDSLLQIKSKSIKPDFFWLTLRCMQHMGVVNIPEKEKECVYHILCHISTFSQDSGNLLHGHLVQDNHLGGIFHSMSERFKYQVDLRPRIKKYLLAEDSDPYIGNLLPPFIELSSVSLDHIKHVITSMNTQKYALKHGQAELYGLDPKKAHKYDEDYHFIFEVLYTATSHNKDTQNFIKSEIESHDKSLHSNTVLSQDLPMENSEPLSLPMENSKTLSFPVHDICPICLEDYSPGQRYVQLCFHTHKLHAQCMDYLVLNAKETHKELQCPTCRGHINYPLAISQHKIEPVTAPPINPIESSLEDTIKN
ncbi:hypothetical protein DFH28DRAFT_1092162 [Melampsora americana]|nr:hypothetical protein DFH28DRAFT_1092162 [Melampsora americana]